MIIKQIVLIVHNDLIGHWWHKVIDLIVNYA